MQPEDRKAIEHFVRVTLGCKCPDEVFRSIALEHVGGQGDDDAHAKLTIGDRLLIYVLEPGNRASPMAVTRIMRMGRNERDARGLNRFRLVIASSRQDDFAGVARDDDRTHLHVVAPAEVPDGLRRR